MVGMVRDMCVMTMDFYHKGELVVREAQYFERLMSESLFQFIVTDILEITLQMRIRK